MHVGVVCVFVSLPVPPLKTSKELSNERKFPTAWRLYDENGKMVVASRQQFL